METGKMDEDIDQDRTIFKIENEAGRFPVQMLLINNLFRFSFENYELLLTNAFNSNVEMLLALQSAVTFIEESDLDEELKAKVNQLIEEEIEVVNYSQSARCSVISM